MRGERDGWMGENGCEPRVEPKERAASDRASSGMIRWRTTSVPREDRCWGQQEQESLGYFDGVMFRSRGRMSSWVDVVFRDEKKGTPLDKN